VRKVLKFLLTLTYGLVAGLPMIGKSVIVFESPTLEDAAKVIGEAVSRRKAVIVVGNCWVNYQGRASSMLESGERILIVKEDGSLLVHRSIGYEPVNWQPPGAIFQTSVEGEALSIQAVRRKPHELLKVYFDRLHLVSILSLVDVGGFSLYASEEDMQKAILIQPAIVESGLKLISYEKKVEPGFIDVYGIDENGRMVVIEIKRKTAGRDAALQLARYLESVKKTTNREVRGILVAPDTAKGVQKLLTTLDIEFKRLDPRRCVEVLRRSEARKLIDFI